MRWSIIRLIWLRELSDQLRDRRTIFMIAVLPLFIYPIAGFGLMQLTIGFFSNKNKVVIVGGESLVATATPRSVASWFAVTPAAPGALLDGLPLTTTALALARAPGVEYPPLLVREDSGVHFQQEYLDNLAAAKAIQIKLDDSLLLGLAGNSEGDDKNGLVLGRWRINRSALDNHEADLLVVIDPDFQATLRAGGRPAVYVVAREGDDRSRLVNNRITNILNQWKKQLKEVRLLRSGLPADYDNPFDLIDPEKIKPVSARAAEELFDTIVKVFPFLLVMWALAGALYPAVDLCAGEKERGTMETLLISPASREEIVYGKFLTIWVFSAATALLNLFSIGMTIQEFSTHLGVGSFGLGILVWCVLLLLPLSAFFSALCLSVGAYARSSKEGQYYLMPLFFITIPLVCLTLAPGVELNPFYSMVPVTGVALLLQKLMAVGTPSRQLGLYFVPVLVPMVIYGWLALRWAIEQFQREEVLFREAERLDLRLWLRQMFRDKEALPSTGQALFCFALILGLHRMTLSVGNRFTLPVQLIVSYLAFVGAPPLFMSLLLTTRPREGLAFRLPPWWAWPAALVLAGLLFVPGAELAYLTVQSLGIKDQLREYQDVMSDGPLQGTLSLLTVLQVVVVLSLLQSVCEELAFRGFILSGLRRRFRPWTAVLLSSFLFALFQMNVFQFAPHFVLGVVMGTLVLQTGSVLSAMIFHFAYNCLVYSCLVIGPEILPDLFVALSYDEVSQAPYAVIRTVMVAGCLIAAVTALGTIVFFRRQTVVGTGGLYSHSLSDTNVPPLSPVLRGEEMGVRALKVPENPSPPSPLP